MVIMKIKMWEAMVIRLWVFFPGVWVGGSLGEWNGQDGVGGGVL